MALEYQYLNQYHGFPNPLAGTPLGPRFGLPGLALLPPRPIAPVYRPPPIPAGYKHQLHGYDARSPHYINHLARPHPQPHPEPEPHVQYPLREPHRNPHPEPAQGQ